MCDERTLIKKFDGQDFSVYKAQMEAFLNAEDLGETIKQRITPITKLEDVPNVQKKELQVKSILLISLDQKYAKLVLSCETSYDIWQKLITTHEDSQYCDGVIGHHSDNSGRRTSGDQGL